MPLNDKDLDPQWIEKLLKISGRCVARPVLDARSDDELAGYDEFGVPADRADEGPLTGE